MKKTVLVAAVLAAWACAASAQSSVTIFGGVDLAARSVKNGSLGSVQSMVSGSNYSSRLGLRGSEDLGGGLSAQFWLESDIAADTGNGGAAAGGSFWNRRSTVSLVSARAGEVRLGRDYIPTHAGACALDPFGCVGLAQNTVGRANPTAVVTTGVGSTNPLVRGNNAVQYITPGNLGGVIATLWISAGEGATTGAAENSKAQGGRLAYVAGPVNVQAALYNIKNTLGAGTPTFKDTFLGASYDFGPAKLAVSRRTYKYLAEQTSVTAGAISGPVGAVGTYKVQFSKVNQGGSVSANDATTLAIGYVHDLSKRTALYGTAMRISNKGAAIFTVGAPGPAVTAANFGGQRSTGYELGLKHSF